MRILRSLYVFIAMISTLKLYIERGLYFVYALLSIYYILNNQDSCVRTGQDIYYKYFYIKCIDVLYIYYLSTYWSSEDGELKRSGIRLTNWFILVQSPDLDAPPLSNFELMFNR